MYTLLPYRLAVALTVNCGYARTAIHELSSSKRGRSRQNIDKLERTQKFREIFDIPTFNLTEEIFTSPNPIQHHQSSFDRYCEKILDHFTKKWNPPSKCIEYINTFAIMRWKELPENAKRGHSMS